MLSDSDVERGHSGTREHSSDGYADLVIRSAEEAGAQSLAAKLAQTRHQLEGRLHAESQSETIQPDGAVEHELQVELQGARDEDGVLNLPPDQITWLELAGLAEDDPATMLSCWQA